jgi:hypothetical protein
MANPSRPQVFVFCSDGLDPSKVDSDFEKERDAAQSEQFLTALMDHDHVSQGNAKRGVRLAEHYDSETCAVYRGWMLTVDQYEKFYEALRAHGLALINDPFAYKACHWLPEGYALIERHTPESRWIPKSELFIGNNVAWDLVLETAASFGSSALVLKDYVKSQKHHWEQACFIPRANEPASVRRVVERFLELQGDDLAGGLVFRRHVPLRSLGTHDRSGMPLGDEYRLFFADGELLFSSCYWEVGELQPDIPMGEFEALAKSIPSRFFTMDVARGADGHWWVIELGDGQVAGLPPNLKPSQFYRAASEFWGTA